MYVPMEGTSIAFIPVGTDPQAKRQRFKVVVDGTEYVTSSALLEDIAHLLSHYTDLAEEGKRFDLFSTNTTPFSVSAIRKHGPLYLMMTDNFDGNILEVRVSLGALRDALARFIDNVLSGMPKGSSDEKGLREGLKRFRDWPVPGP
jgi:hypothetical protein